mgnify:CR=1 FL=1
MKLQSLTPFLQLLSNESSEIIKKYFRTSVNVENKSDSSPVTNADKLAEERMREIIAKESPGSIKRFQSWA